MIALSINVNKIALIRNSRSGNYPDVVSFAERCIQYGANGITVHPRPDQRHIRPSDVRHISDLLRPLDDIEFNIEGNPFQEKCGDYPGLIALVEETNPDQCTLVPDSNDQLTSDHGFNLNADGERLIPVIKYLQSKGVRVSLFMDPDLEQIGQAAQMGTDRIELYTGPYASAWGAPDFEQIFRKYRAAAELAHALGLGVNAGHDLNLKNLSYFCTIGNIREVSIGHAFTVDSLNLGLALAVEAYRSELSKVL